MKPLYTLTADEMRELIREDMLADAWCDEQDEREARAAERRAAAEDNRELI